MSEATQDVVVCTGCGKSYRVKPELAGRKAKCKCGETVRFPMGASAVGLEPLESRAEPRPPQDEYDVVEPVKAVVAPVPQKMMACKGCTSPMPASAVLCTRCGMNQKTGKKMGTQVQGASPDVSDVVVAAGKGVLSLVLGGLTAVVMAAIWLALIYFTDMKLGFFALAVGGAVGFVVRLINPYGSTMAGLIAGGMALLGIGIVKLLFVWAAIRLGNPFIALSIYDLFCIPGGILLAARMGAGLTR